MNQNDMDRYFWRTGQHWSGDDRLFKRPRRGPELVSWVIVLLFAAFAPTVAMLSLPR